MSSRSDGSPPRDGEGSGVRGGGAGEWRDLFAAANKVAGPLRRIQRGRDPSGRWRLASLPDGMTFKALRAGPTQMVEMYIARIVGKDHLLSDDRQSRHQSDSSLAEQLPVRKPAERAAAEYALLGLIAQTADGEIHGYDLSRSFAEGALGRIIRLEPGMLYHFLKKLARDGFITSRVERQTGRPDRQVHALTPQGDAQLRTWIASPVRSTREIRLEFLVKLYLARAIDPRHAVTLVTGQRSVMRARAARLTEQVDTPQPPGADSSFGESVLQLRLTQTRAALDWLDTLPESRG